MAKVVVIDVEQITKSEFVDTKKRRMTSITYDEPDCYVVREEQGRFVLYKQVGDKYYKGLMWPYPWDRIRQVQLREVSVKTQLVFTYKEPHPFADKKAS